MKGSEDDSFSPSSTPRRDRPVMPAGYGVPRETGGMLEWRWVEERLQAARNYWVASTRSDGRPHVMPVWGLWLEQSFWFGTDRRSRKARNILDKAEVTVHLESGDEAIILEGVAEEIDPCLLLETIDRFYSEKYSMKLTDAPGQLVVFRVRPRRVIAWLEKHFPASATRWTFVA